MKIIIIILLAAGSLFAQSADVPVFKIADIGDMGENNTDQMLVADLINWLNPDIIKTNGDNIYGVTSRHNTYDSVIKKYYPAYYSPDPAKNKFFPCIGNHDLDEFPPGNNGEFRWAYALSYTSYFALPNNERYYSINTSIFNPKSSIKLISFNSDFGGIQTYCGGWQKVFEPGGIDSASVQAGWVRNELITSAEKFNIIQMHYPPIFSFGSLYYNNIIVNCVTKFDTVNFRIDTLFKMINWVANEPGVSLITAGHNHLFEAVGSKLMINGLGGGLKVTDTSSFTYRCPGSRKLYTAQFGCGLINEYSDSLQYLFINVDRDTVWRQTIYPLRSVKVKAFFSDFDDFDEKDENSANKNRTDTLRVYLRNENSPHNIIDSSAKVLNQNGEGVFYFANSRMGERYFLSLKHKGSVETISTSTVMISDTTAVYDFTTQ